jgi:hypothetical protein
MESLVWWTWEVNRLVVWCLQATRWRKAEKDADRWIASRSFRSGDLVPDAGSRWLTNPCAVRDWPPCSNRNTPKHDPIAGHPQGDTSQVE